MYTLVHVSMWSGRNWPMASTQLGDSCACLPLGGTVRACVSNVKGACPCTHCKLMKYKSMTPFQIALILLSVPSHHNSPQFHLYPFYECRSSNSSWLFAVSLNRLCVYVLIHLILCAAIATYHATMQTRARLEQQSVQSCIRYIA